MGPTPFYRARAEKPRKKADFAMKQTNMCRLSGDIITDDDRQVIRYTALYITEINTRWAGQSPT